jgi:acyl-coenzyme A synthetase/AMP-(fatty) acid ligase
MRRDELPVTATGKVQKFRLAEMLARERDPTGA